MTDQELIKALREDAPRIGWLGWGRPNDVGKKMADAADRLEALLADNAALGQEIDRQICKRSELEQEIGRLEIQVEHLRAGAQLAVELDPDTGSFSIGFQQPRPKWVSVEERLPENNDKQVLVVANGIYDGIIHFHDAVEIAEFVWDEGWILESWPDWENPCVKFWQPLPEPPSTEGWSE